MNLCIVNEDHPQCNVPRKAIKACLGRGWALLGLLWPSLPLSHLESGHAVPFSPQDFCKFVHCCHNMDPMSWDPHQINAQEIQMNNTDCQVPVFSIKINVTLSHSNKKIGHFTSFFTPTDINGDQIPPVPHLYVSHIYSLFPPPRILTLVIPLLGIYLKKPKTLIWKYRSILMFIAAFFTTTKIFYKQPKYPLIDEWIKQLWHLETKWNQEDKGKVGGNRAQFSLCPAGTPSWSSEEQGEQPMESQLIWSLIAKNCRGHWKTDGEGEEMALGR